MNVGSNSSESEQQSTGGQFSTGGNVSGGVNLGQGVNVGVNTGQNGSQSVNNSFSNQASQSQQNIWGPQTPYLQDIYGQAQGQFNTDNPRLLNERDRALGMVGDLQYGANPAYQSQLQGGVFGEQGSGSDFRDYTQGIGQGSMGQYDTNFNQYLGDMNTALSATADDSRNAALSSLDARAAASGMSGGSRQGQAQGRALGQIDQNLQSNMANVSYNAFEADQARQQQAFEADRNRRMQGVGMYGDTLNSRQQAQQQSLGQVGNMSQLANAGFNPYNNAWNGLNSYGALVGGPTTLASSTGGGQSGTAGSSQSYGNTFGANLGQNQNLGFNFGLGSNYGMGLNQSTGQSEGSGWNFGYSGGTNSTA